MNRPMTGPPMGPGWRQCDRAYWRITPAAHRPDCVKTCAARWVVERWNGSVWEFVDEYATRAEARAFVRARRDRAARTMGEGDAEPPQSVTPGTGDAKNRGGN